MEPFLKKKSRFFPFLGEKSTKCVQKAVKCLLCHIFNVQQKKKSISPFPIKFSILEKSKMAAKIAATFDEVTTFDDVTAPSSATPHNICLIL